MIWPFGHRKPRPSEEAVDADVQASRALLEAKALTSRADSVADRIAQTARRNGFGAAVIKTFRGA